MHACLSASVCACICLCVRLSVCLYVSLSVCVCRLVCLHVCVSCQLKFGTGALRPSMLTSWSWPSTDWRFFGGFFSFACCGRRLKIYIGKLPRVPGLSVPSLAANKDGRTFGDKKGWKRARCDGGLMQSLLFWFLFDSVQNWWSYALPKFMWLHGDRRGRIFCRRLFQAVAVIK